MADIAKQRSPRYPVISLRDAVIKATLVYRQDYRNKIPKEIVARHMGYNSLNGASLGVISAVSKYGLLDGGSDAMAITERAVHIIEREPGDPERIASIQEAAAEPELFRDVKDEFPTKVSDAAIRSYLITKRGFLPDAATRFLEAYRETDEYVDLESSQGQNPASQPNASPQIMTQQDFEPVTPEGKIAQLQGQLATAVLAVTPAEGERELVTGMLSKGASFRLIVSGTVGVKEIERLIKKLELDKEILADEDEPEGQRGSSAGGVFD